MSNAVGFNAPWLLDSNVLVYAYDKDSQDKQGKAIALIEEARYNRLAYTGLQNLGELAAVLAKKNIAKDVLIEIIDELQVRFNLVGYTAKTLAGAVRLVFQHGVPFWDAVIAQTMLENGIDTIVTENEADFKRVPGIKVVNPFRG